ncbi:MAG TPA: ATP-binding protein [Blastocatellia bacterium]|nr:ATP-binding protein [Blastocatellia bacterium]
MRKIGTIKLIGFFVVLTIALTWLVIISYEKLLRQPFYAWVEASYPGDRVLQDSIEQRIEHFGISTMVDVIVVSLLLRLVNSQQRKLRASEERYRALFEHASDGIGVVTSTDHRLVDVNKKFAEIVGYQTSALQGRHICDLFQTTEDTAEVGSFSAVVNCGLARNEALGAWSGDREIMIRAINGRPMPVSISASSISAGKEKLFILLIRDLTEQKRLQREKEDMQLQLFQSSKLASIGELSAGVAHEINNPLNCIVNFAQLLKDDEVARDESQRQMIDGIIDEGDRIARIVRDLLTFSRQGPHVLTKVAVCDVIRNAVSLFGHQLVKDGIATELDLPEDGPSVLGDASRLRQVVVNMISNAHHALQEKDGEPKIFRVSARSLEKEGSQFSRIEFYDTGAGIRRENLSRVFDPFFTTRRDSGGTGLGLSLSFGIIRDYGGTIAVESEEGSYTRFTVELPSAAFLEAEYAESTAGGRRA